MKPEKREHEPRTDWPGEYEFHLGMSPTCHKTDGYISIEGWEWFYCRTHRVRWCAGLREVATCRLQTTIPPEKLCSELELDSFTEVEESTWCRLCHVVIDDGERGWDAHLAAKHRCPYCEIDLDGKGDYRRHLANAHALERPQRVQHLLLGRRCHLLLGQRVSVLAIHRLKEPLKNSPILRQRG